MNVHDIGGKRSNCWHIVLIAGFAGGIAEIAWVGIYCYLTGTSSIEVARQVAVTVSLEYPAAPFFGVLMHLALSFAAAAVYSALIWHPITARYGAALSMLVAMAVLAAVWAVNFLLILPVLNPGFVKLMPYPVTIVSKLLFGICMALAFKFAGKDYLFPSRDARLALAQKTV